MDDHKGNLTLLAETMTERDRYRDALIEIRDVAAGSTGVGWYEMIANKALYPHTEVKAVIGQGFVTTVDGVKVPAFDDDH